MKYTFNAKFEPRDVWVGLFWDKRLVKRASASGNSERVELHVYVCPVPCFVMHWTLVLRSTP